MVAMRRAGEILTAFTLSMAGLKAAAGMTALVTTHGPNRILRPYPIFPLDGYLAPPKVLDAPRGDRGTTTMTGMRKAADLGEYTSIRGVKSTGFYKTVILRRRLSLLSK